MIRLWVAGFVAGTMLVWLTSPLFVRSYHSKVYDPVCQGLVYPVGTKYRWRSEGYATTAFGPYGMPGRKTLPERSAARVVALWGDSQAEGVCVADQDKLWRVLQTRLRLEDETESSEVLPMAHSGENAANWTRGFAAAEEQLGVTEHVLLVCELDDLTPLAHPASDSLAGTRSRHGSGVIDFIPDFVIHAARGLIFQGDSVELRRLRFSVGPVTNDVETRSHKSVAPMNLPAADIAARLVESTNRPVTVLYAPSVPRIMGGEIRWDDPQDPAFVSLAEELRQHGVRVVDCRDGLRQLAVEGAFPHGFQNGVIGNGHLNPAGYHAIAESLTQGERPRE